MQQVQNVQFAIAIDVIQSKGKYVIGLVEVFLLENCELPDKTRQTNFYLVQPITHHIVEHLAEIDAVIAKDILHITDDILLGQIKLILVELLLLIGCLLLLVGEIVEESLEKCQVMLILLCRHFVAYRFDLMIEEWAWAYFLICQLHADMRMLAPGCGLLMVFFLVKAVWFASDI